MADSIYTFDPVPANNTALDSIPYGPNQLYHGQIDNWFRALASKLAQFVDDLGAVNTVAGTGDAVTVTLASGITAYATGQFFRFIAGAANTGAATMNVNSIGAKAIRKISGGTDVALSAGDIAAGETYLVRYSATANSAAGAWIIVGSGATAAWRRNRIVNPAMQVSQENANTSGTTNGYFAADQWSMDFVSSAGTFTAQRVQSATPYKSKSRFRVTITAADASLAAGEFLKITQKIEGNEIADFGFGASGARQTVLRFGFKGPAGTYSISYRNSAANRSYVKTFSPTSANTDEYITIAVPGDTSGTWVTDTGVGLELSIVLATGSTFQGTDATWTASSLLGTSSNSNGMGTIASVFEIFDVGLYLDAESTGVAPMWELPDYDDTERQCQRYLPAFLGAAAAQPLSSGFSFSTTNALFPVRFLVPSRVAPTGVTVSSAAHFTVRNGTAGSVTATGFALDTAGTYAAGVVVTVASGLTAGQGSQLDITATSTAKLLFTGCRL